jgi:hypothetical protein
MSKKLIAGLFLTAVTAMPLMARADWDNLSERKTTLEQKGQNLEQKGDDLETRGKTLKAEGAADESKGRSDLEEGKTVEKKSVTTYHNGRKTLKTTTDKVRTE